MGVKGLWTILEPAGEPIDQASLSGHRLAVDASIWMYQLTKALPDSSSGAGGYNPQILAGLFRRILKLLHFGIRPVFVFDGGVPELKISTVRERRGRRAEAESRYKVLAKKMLKIRLKMLAIGAKGEEKQVSSIIVEDEEKDDEEVDQSEESSEEEELYDIDYEQLDRLDITSRDFQALPLDLKQELLSAMKERAMEARRDRGFASSSKDALSFSQGQIEALVKRRRIAAELERVSRSSFGAFGSPIGGLGDGFNGPSYRIASSSTKEFILVKNESGAGWSFDRPKTEEDGPVRIADKSSPIKAQSIETEDEAFEKMFFQEESGDEKTVEPVPKQVVEVLKEKGIVSFESESDSEAELLEASEIIQKTAVKEILQPIDKSSNDASESKEPLQQISILKDSIDEKEAEMAKEEFQIAKTETETIYFVHPVAHEFIPVSHEKPFEVPVPIQIEEEAKEELEDLDDFLETFKGTTKEDLEERLRQSLIEAQTDLRAAQGEARGLENELLADFKHLLSLFGIPFMTAEMEAEAQCAWLHAQGLVDGVITDDSDVWLFAPEESLLVYRNFFKEGRAVVAFGGPRIALRLGLRREDFVCLAMCLGGDYGTGVRGLGTKRALTLLQILKRSQTYVSQLENDQCIKYCLTLLNLFKAAHEDFDAVRAEWTLEDQLALEKILRNVHHLEADFPSRCIIQAYLEPAVLEDRRAFKWQLPNVIGLEAFLKARLEWPPERTKSQLLPILRSKTNI